MNTHLAHIASTMFPGTVTSAPASLKADASRSTRALGEPSSSPSSTSNSGVSTRIVPSFSSWVAIRSTPPSTAGPNRPVRASTWAIPLRNGMITAGGFTAGSMSAIAPSRSSDFTASTIAS